MESENESAEATTPSAAAGQAQSILGHSVTRRQVLSGLAAGALVPALGRDLIRSAGTTVPSVGIEGQPSHQPLVEQGHGRRPRSYVNAHASCDNNP